MKTRNLVLNFTVAIFALCLGLLLVGFSHAFFSSIEETATENEISANANLQTDIMADTDPAWDANISNTEDFETSEYDVKEAVKDAADKAAEAVKESNDEYTEEQKFLLDLDIEGHYANLNSFNDESKFEEMEIWFGEYNEELQEWVEGPPSGFIKINGVEYSFRKFQYSHGKVFFETEKKNGLRFQFLGEYRNRKIIEDDIEYDSPILSGMLSKYKMGKRLDLQNISFSWYQGC